MAPLGIYQQFIHEQNNLPAGRVPATSSDLRNLRMDGARLLKEANLARNSGNISALTLYKSAILSLECAYDLMRGEKSSRVNMVKSQIKYAYTCQDETFSKLCPLEKNEIQFADSIVHAPIRVPDGQKDGFMFPKRIGEEELPSHGPR